MSGRGFRARHVHVMSLNLLTSRTSPLRALYLNQTADESALEKTEPLSLRYAQLPTSTSSQSLKNILKPPDISYDHLFFAKIYTETLKLSTHSHRCLFGGKTFKSSGSI